MRALGLSRGEIAERCSQGWLIRRHTGVYAVGHVPSTRESRWHAGVLALGEGAVLGHVAAGAHWGILPRSAVTEVIVPTTAGRTRRDGILVHRQRLPAAHTTVHRGIPVTTPIRTLLDLAAVLPTTALAKAFEEAQVKLHVPPAPLAAEVLSRPRQRGTRSSGGSWWARSTRLMSVPCSSCGSFACAPPTASRGRSERPHRCLDPALPLARPRACRRDRRVSVPPHRRGQAPRRDQGRLPSRARPRRRPSDVGRRHRAAAEPPHGCAARRVAPESPWR